MSNQTQTLDHSELSESLYNRIAQMQQSDLRKLSNALASLFMSSTSGDIAQMAYFIVQQSKGGDHGVH